MSISIKRYTADEQGPEFYALMGPYFANRKYADEMGGWQFYNEDQSVWWVAFDGDQIAGFCCALVKSTHIFWDNFYIMADWRENGLSRQLIDARLEYCLEAFDKEIRCITNNARQMNNYEQVGMQKCGMRGRYTKYKREL